MFKVSNQLYSLNVNNCRFMVSGMIILFWVRVSLLHYINLGFCLQCVDHLYFRVRAVLSALTFLHYKF